MLKRKLTDRLVDSFRPEAKDVIHWDNETQGFGCVVRPSGKKVYFVYFRTVYGQQRRPMIGAHGSISCVNAREIAQDWLTEVRRGGDPSQERKRKRLALTVTDLTEKYLTEYATVHKKASSVKEDRRIIDKRINPRLGNLAVEAVTREDIRQLHLNLRDTPYEANRVLSLLSKMFHLAEDWGVRPENSSPCRHKKFPELKRSRFYSPEELARIGHALDLLANSDRQECLNAIRLLALTGCRLSEVASLEWGWIDLENGLISLPDSKTGPRPITLGSAATTFLAGLGRHGRWVFPNPTGDASLSPSLIEHCWKRVRHTAGIENGRLHDFRHTVGTYSSRSGHNAFVIRDLLGHKTLAMTGRYVERDVGPLRSAANIVSETISTAMKSQAGT